MDVDMAISLDLCILIISSTLTNYILGPLLLSIFLFPILLLLHIFSFSFIFCFYLLLIFLSPPINWHSTFYSELSQTHHFSILHKTLPCPQLLGFPPSIFGDFKFLYIMLVLHLHTCCLFDTPPIQKHKCNWSNAITWWKLWISTTTIFVIGHLCHLYGRKPSSSKVVVINQLKALGRMHLISHQHLSDCQCYYMMVLYQLVDGIVSIVIILWGMFWDWPHGILTSLHFLANILLVTWTLEQGLFSCPFDSLGTYPQVAYKTI